jgi:seryl-tRNA synthetase
MLDINYIRENPEKVAQDSLNKGVKIDVKKLLDLDKKRVSLIEKRDSLRSNRKNAGKPTAAEIAKIKKSKAELEKIEKELAVVEENWLQIMKSMPNPALPDVIIGPDDSANKVKRTEGKIPKFSFEPKDHIELTEMSEEIDGKRGAKVSGSRFFYIKGKIAQLELALINYAFDTLTKEGFIPVFPPVLISRESMAAMGYLEHGGDDEIYHLPKDDMFLVGTSEQSVGPMHQGETFEESQLPIRYAAFSSCFRREAGSYGKDTKGIIRVHQFDKIEMFSFVAPESSAKEHDFLLSLEEKLVKGLKLPYHVLDIASGDLGLPAAKKYDIECWVPSQNKYRETHSTSNCTDFQARRLNIKYRKPDGTKYLVHTLNGTAFAIGRMLVTIIENYQKKDGSIEVPVALQKYTKFKVIK